MTGETESQPEESRASSETGEGSEDRDQQRLDDATLDPGALIEQSGDIRQAETTQESFTALVEEAGDLVGRQSKPAEGPFEQGSCGGDDSGDEATPINLPGPQAIAATPQPISNEAQEVLGATNEIPACDGATKNEALPLGGDVRVERRFTWSAQEISATPQPIPNEAGEAGATRTPEKPRQEGEFEKPILNQELEDLDSGLAGVDAIDSLTPGLGIIDGESGSEDLGFMDFGGAGYEAVTKFLAGIQSPVGPTGISGDVGNPVGASPAGHTGTSGDVENPGSTDTGTGSKLWSSGTDPKPIGEHENQDSPNLTSDDIMNDFMSYCKDAHDSGDQPQDGDVSGWVAGKAADFFSGKFGDSTLTEILRSLAKDKTGAGSQTTTTVTRIQEDGDDDDGGDDDGGDDDGEDDDGGDDDEGGDDGDEDLSEEGDAPSKMEKAPIHGGPSQKSDQDQISNYPEDHIAGNQGGGVLNEEHAEALERTLDNKAKLAGSAPKVTTDQVTDPQEHDLGKKSEAGKQGG